MDVVRVVRVRALAGWPEAITRREDSGAIGAAIVAWADGVLVVDGCDGDGATLGCMPQVLQYPSEATVPLQPASVQLAPAGTRCAAT